MADDLARFRESLDLVAIVQSRVKLTRRGQEYIGNCPFHQEKTPSFHVIPAKGFYHCFGCSAHGSAIDFVMNHDNLDFVSAVKALCDQFGLETPFTKPSQGQKRENKTIHACLDLVADWFGKALSRPDGYECRTYLERRAVSDEAIEHFSIGFAPQDQQSLVKFVETQGYTLEHLCACDVFARDQDTGRIYPRFRNRLMFPIRDGRSRIVGFGGRAMADQKAKYLNSPDADHFHKGQILYHFDEARKSLRQADHLLVVEGYMDVVGLKDAGIPHAVAPLGTALTEQQITMAWKATDHLVLCLDGDAAGQKAAWRSVEKSLALITAGKRMSVATMPTGEDPDSLVKSHGKQAFASVVAAAKPMSDIIYQHITFERDIANPEDRAAARADLRTLVQQIQDPDVKNAFADSLFSRLSIKPDFKRNIDANNPRFTGSSARFSPLAVKKRPAEIPLLRPILYHPDFLRDPECLDAFEQLIFTDPGCERLQLAILDWLCENVDVSPLEREHLFDYLHGIGEGFLCRKLLEDKPWSVSRIQDDMAELIEDGERRHEWLQAMRRFSEWQEPRNRSRTTGDDSRQGEHADEYHARLHRRGLGRPRQG